jgi:hypothetical protein
VDVDPELFFLVGESGREVEAQGVAAKTVCSRCPVRAECLADALVGMPYGVAGGLTAEERRGLGARRTVSVLAGPPEAATPGELASAGRAAIRAEWSVEEFAAEFEVSERTAYRWGDQVRHTERGAA